MRVAGLMVETNRPVAEQQDGGPPDGSVQVLFKESGTPLGDASDWLCFEQEGFATAWFQKDGSRVDVRDPAGSNHDYAAELRRVVPFASALQGKIVLHGSAVRWNDRVVVFVGESGAGKSTLAQALSDLGLIRVSDDLIPVRLNHDNIAIPYRDADGEPGALALGAICFLQRSASCESPYIEALAKKDVLARACQNSFGELRSAKSWRVQFEALGKITDRVPGVVLTMPDDIERYAEHAGRVARDLIPELLTQRRPA